MDELFRFQSLVYLRLRSQTISIWQGWPTQDTVILKRGRQSSWWARTSYMACVWSPELQGLGLMVSTWTRTSLSQTPQATQGLIFHSELKAAPEIKSFHSRWRTWMASSRSTTSITPSSPGWLESKVWPRALARTMSSLSYWNTLKLHTQDSESTL